MTRGARRPAVLGAVVLAAVVTGGAPGAAGAATVKRVPGGLTGMHDARYCEILELRGAPPTGTVQVYNTIGLNACPPAQWQFDAPSLAQELGATLVVLNGPRHFLMDAVTGSAGPTRTFHGLAMRKVASIAIRSASDLVVRPFTDRIVKRDNIWRWSKGRTVFELVAPGGDTYVMQSYSQIKDPSLTYAKLAKLGPRLGLPEGWRYRTRVLRKPLALAARGVGATITQDELGNTYQLATTVRRGPRKSYDVKLDARTATVPPRTPGTVEDHGTVTSTPFGAGRLVLVGTFADGKLEATVRLTFKDGSVVVTTALPFTNDGNQVHFRGTSQVLGGTGAYRGITSGPLQTADDNTIDGQNGVVSVTGRVTY